MNGVERRKKHAAVGLFAVLAIALVVNSVLAVHEYLDQESLFDPWGEFPVQTVLNDNRTLRVGETLEVEATKCIDHDEEIISVGEVRWTAQDPRGVTFVVGTGIGRLQPGCDTLTYRNPMPAQVVELANTEGEARTWTVNGSQWAFDDDGQRGKEQTWETQPFVVEP